MGRLNLREIAATLPGAWSSTEIAAFGEARLKILRMDGTAYPEETHAYREGLLVLDGEMRLRIEDRLVTVSAGEIYVVEAGVPHAVEPGSHGVLAILDT